jgi:hypothetical protein
MQKFGVDFDNSENIEIDNIPHSGFELKGF